MTVTTPLPESYWPADPGEELLDTTVSELLRRAAAEVPDRPALVDAVPDPALRRTWTYAELLADAERVARALLARFTPGERIAVWAPNCAEWVLLQQGLSLAGLVLVAVNPMYRDEELRFVLRQSRAAGLVQVDAFRDVDLAATVARVRPDLPELREVVSLSQWDAFLAGGSADTALPDVRPDTLVQIQYTSGTTGFPKGALLHHKGVVNASRFVAIRGGMAPGDVWVNAMPMFHIGGGAVAAFGTLAQQGTLVLAPGFDPALVLELFETHRGTIGLLVPTMLVAVLDHPDRPNRDLRSIKTVLSGASMVPAALVRRTRETFGCDFSILFGQTEMHGVISQTLLDDSPEDQSETIGRPLPQVEVRIADPAGETLPVGESGEICIRGYQTMIGFFELPEETAQTLDVDGWLHSGDLGAMDDRGYLRITGRLKDMIIRGGLNIYPREIEDVLFAHPGVAEVAVVGVPDERWGERIAAVVRATGERPSAGELLAYCQERLSAHKAPVDWFFVDALPVTPSGKIQKFAIQERIADGTIRSEPA